MLARMIPALLLSACSVGVIPRDVPPPEPAPEPASVEAAGPAPVEAGTQPAEPAPGPVSYSLDGNRLTVPGPIDFWPGSDQLLDASAPALEYVRGYLAAKDAITTLRIEGHAEDQALSERRAVAVARWLVKYGVDCKRLIAVGFGPNKPRADASTPEGKAENTRIEVHNAALRGRPIGGADLHGGGQVASADLCAR